MIISNNAYAKIKIIESSDLLQFENAVNTYLETGWSLCTVKVGFINSEKFNFAGVYQAVVGMPLTYTPVGFDKNQNLN